MHSKRDRLSSANQMWGGHYSRGPAEVMQQINASIGFDHLMYREDIAGSKAHATMLAEQGILTQNEAKQIINGLNKIEKEIAAGEMVFDIALEDIHMHIESRLKELIGDIAGKLHTARSRNDQVATDFRLWIRRQIDELDADMKAMQAALLEQAEAHDETVMPGFTHLQIAQPVVFAHHLLAYVEMLGRDRGRLKDTRARLNELPLGAAALAGTSYPIDREQVAKHLGFSAPMANSIDAVSDRDFAMEFLSTCSIAMVHLSRLAEEFVLWSSPAFGFIQLSESFTTGSSIMPQKRNPDGAELVRGKTGRVIGALQSLLVTMKGLPLTYNKDSQEDKEPAFDAAGTLRQCLHVMRGMVEDMTVNTARMEAMAEEGYSTATDLADYLVQNFHVPFRDAHHITGRIVKYAESKQKKLHELSIAELTKLEPRLNESVYAVLKPEQSINRRTSQGGTAPKRVKKAIQSAKKKYL